MKIIWISTAVTPYSEVDPKYANAATNDCLKQFVEGLKHLGIESTLLLPEKSDCSINHVLFAGTLQNTVAVGDKVDTTGTATGTILSNMVEWLWEHQDEFDLAINIGHDFLPIFMVGKLRIPLITLPNLCSTTLPMDEIIRKQALKHPSHVWFFSERQRQILGNHKNPIIHQSFDISNFSEATRIHEGASLGWAGRIVKEKGLMRAAQIAFELNRNLWVAGPIHDQDYFESVMREYPNNVQYLGCLSRKELYAQLSKTSVFLQTQEDGWEEAFGRITAEAFLSGCPVLYHQCGANEELSCLTDGGVLIDNQNLRSCFEAALNKDRTIIQKKAFEQFERKFIAKKFLQLASQVDTKIERMLNKTIDNSSN